MGLLDMLMGNTLGDREIASDMLKDSKFAVMSLGQAVSEVVNPELRQILVNQLLLAVDQHYRLSDLVTKKDWYQPFLAPRQQISQDLRLADNAVSDR